MRSEGDHFTGARDSAAAAARAWAIDEDGRDRLAFDGIPVAEALAIEVFQALLPLALEASGSRSELALQGLAGRLKRQGLDRPARIAGTIVAAARPSRSHAERPTLTGSGHDLTAMFVVETPTPSMLGSALRVAVQLSEGAITLAAHPGAIRPFRERGLIVRPLVTPMRLGLRRLVGASRDVRRAWSAIEWRPRPIVLGGIDVTANALRVIEPIVVRGAPWLAIEREALRAAIGRLQPKWVVVASDQHRIGRLAVDVARERGPRSLVLQHGLPQFDLGYVPVHADKVAAWSPGAARWFTDHGTPTDHLIVSGNPRGDDLVAADREHLRRTISEGFRPGSKANLLIALSPSERSRNDALVALGVEFARAQKDVAVIVKLHPGDGDWTATRETVATAGNPRVRIAHREPLAPLLAWADAVLLHRSTVALEALAAGTPVLLDTPGSQTMDTDLATLELPWVDSPGALAATLQAVSGAKARGAFFGHRAAALDEAVGPRDGRTAERIATFLRAAG
ncbi:MAG: hypothetical protein ABI598_06875 [Chloroflexota bacterium]